MARDVHRSPAELAELANRFPAPILNDARANDPLPLAELFAYEEARILPFGERLIMTAGLFVAALYVDTARHGPLDSRLPIIIRPLLMSRSYSSGMAISILQRLPAAGVAIGIDPRPDWSCISRFLEIRGATYGNTWRALHEESIEDLFANVLEYLSFLREFSFTGEANVARIGTRTIHLWPFLRWDGQMLSGLRESRLIGDRGTNGEYLPTRLLFAHENVLLDPSQIEDVVDDLAPAETARLAEVAKRIGLDLPATPGEIPFDTESFIPILSDNYSRMQQLLDLIYQHANQDTRRAWVEEYLQKGLKNRPQRKQVATAARDRATVENAILALCLERDPVAVLTEYLEREPGDQLTCLRQLDPGNAVALY